MNKPLNVVLIAAGTLLAILGVLSAHDQDVKKNALAQQAITQAQQKAEALRQGKEKADAKAKALELDAASYKAQAATYKAKSESLEKDLASAKSKLASLKPVPPVTDQGRLPQDSEGLVAAYGQEGFGAVVSGGGLLFQAQVARPMLALIRDGKEYPNAIATIDAQKDEIVALNGQKEALNNALEEESKRGDSLESANASLKQGEADAQGIANQKQVIIDATNTELNVEKHKKFYWGAFGVAAGWVLKAVIVAL